MDIDRFRQTAASVQTQAEKDKQFTISFFNNTTKYFLQILPTFADKISFKKLDDIINEKIKQNQDLEEYTLTQKIYSPRVEGNELRYTQVYYSGDLWSLTDEVYTLKPETTKILKENAQYIPEYRNAYWLEKSFFAKYIEEYLLDKVTAKLAEYGATVTNMKVNEGYDINGKRVYGGVLELAITIKNPLK